MSFATAAVTNGPLSQVRPVLADLVGRSRVKDVVAVTAGAAWVALLGQVSIPLGFTPIPLSLGTFAVLTAGTVLGAQRATAAMALFLAAGFAGLPVFAGARAGIGLPTLGYAVGYIAAAALAGWAAQRGFDRSYWKTFAVMATGSSVIYLLGVPYLAVSAHLSLAEGIAQGLTPFLLGDLIKALAAAAALPGAWKLAGQRGRASQ
jgi:biotin transport system substrate-specific component